MKPSPYIVAISGASGVIYGLRLIKALVALNQRVIVILSRAGEHVLSHEMGYQPGEDFRQFLISYGILIDEKTPLEIFFEDQIASAPASGSFVHSGMAVVPCSMKTLSAISSGFADTLLTRSADVSLKEKRPLIIVPRETPYNLIHLENMTRVHQAGAVILPPSPSFYSFPDSVEALVDTVVARILDHLGVTHDLIQRWQ